MRKVLGILVIGIASLVPAFWVADANASPASHHRPFALTDVTVQNVQTSLFVIGHGHGNPLTTGGVGNGRWSQINCVSSAVCEWKDVSNGLCWDAGRPPSSGIVSEESCQFGLDAEEWNTSNGPNGPNNPGYWFWNEGWNSLDHCNTCAYTGELFNDQIGANEANNNSNYQVWHVSS